MEQSQKTIRKLKPDPRLAILQRALDFLDEFCDNFQQYEVWNLLLLQYKLNDVRKSLLSRRFQNMPSDPDMAELLKVLNYRLTALAYRIKNAISIYDPRAIELFGEVLRWYTGNDNDPPEKNTVDENKHKRKRSHQSKDNEVTDQRFIKYRRNAVDDYSQIANSNNTISDDVDENNNEDIIDKVVKSTEEEEDLDKEFSKSEKYSEVEDSESEFVSFTDSQDQRYNELVHGEPKMILISKFGLNITRKDILTLTDRCWLNDSIINFYMNLITDRSLNQQDNRILPSVYAMNTFFLQQMMKGGYSSVKRWTRKVDIFSKDIILIPVHVQGFHWCMAIIHIKNKTIHYYDSMGKSNQMLLNNLQMYLQQESMDKRNLPFDTSEFQMENAQNIPQQTNSSDCGVFTCMFAEHITRNKTLNFRQEHMPFFRKKMVLEICEGQLWM